MATTYTRENLQTQLALVEKQLAVERQLLQRLPQLMEDVRANHERTINMRISHYEKQVTALREKLTTA